MKDDNTFNEELFRDAFSDFSPEPPKDMLERIQKDSGRAHTGSNKKKWIAGASALIILSVGIYNYEAPVNESSKAVMETQVTEAEDIPENPVIEEITLTNLPEENIIEESKKTVIIEKIDTITKTVIIEVNEIPEKYPEEYIKY